MKQFILLVILATLSAGLAFAADDDFVDTSVQVTPPPSDETSRVDAQTEEMPGNLETPIQPEPVVTEQPPELMKALESPFKQAEETQHKTGEVVLEKQTDFTQSYKDRRSRHGVLFSIDYEKFYPSDYFSQYRDVYIENIIDTDRINLLGAELGYKLNFQLGSLAILANYAHGTINGLVGTAERTITLKRYGLSANFAMDNFFNEPWIVPYGQVGTHQFQVEEDDLTQAEAKSATTKLSFNYKFGLLFQLNWIEKAIDPDTQFDGLRSSGLQNTFLDLYMADHMASSETYDPKDSTSKGDPDLASGLEMGIGLKMEF